MPMERSVLVIRCSGPAGALPRVCAQVSADLELRDGSVQSLAPDESVAQRLRVAGKRLGVQRREQRARMAAAAGQSEFSAAAADLARVYEGFAGKLAALPTNAQDVAAIAATAASARRAAAAYADLAGAAAGAAWSASRDEAAGRDGELEKAVRRLGALGVYPGS